MKRKLLSLLFLSILFSLGGCVKDDLEELQNQVDDLKQTQQELDQKVAELEQAQQQALLQAIADLQAAIAELETSNDAQYAALLESLTILEEEVANNESAVYYGNLLTDEDYAAYTAQGATIVTGKVIASTAAHGAALANLRMVGGNMILSATESLELTALESVGEELLITETTGDAVISFPKLASIGSSFEVMNNSAMTELVADALVLINGELYVTKNPALTTLSMASLDQVHEVYINEYLENDPNFIGLASLSTVDLSSANVLGDVRVEYVSGGSLALGEIDGSFYLSNTSLTELLVNSESIDGDFTMQYNGALTTIDFSTIKLIDGDVAVSYNNTDWWDWQNPTGLETLPAFAALETINGDVRVEGNGFLTSLEIFNSVTVFTGAEINFSSNGNSGAGLDLVNVFNALADGGPSQWTKMNISIFENTLWFDGFNSLTTAKDLYITVYGLLDPNTFMTGKTKIDGFDAMTSCQSLNIYGQYAESFEAFPALDNFTGFVNTYLNITMPEDSNVGMCSMEPIFTKIKNGDFDQAWNPDRAAKFYYNWSELDRDTAIDQLLAPCTP